MRLIDKDALIETFKQKCVCECPVCAYVIGNCDGCELITKAPEVEEIVRCRDCKHYVHVRTDAIGHCTKDISCWHFRDMNWYCADGERRSDDGRG